MVKLTIKLLKWTDKQTETGQSRGRWTFHKRGALVDISYWCPLLGTDALCELREDLFDI